MLNRAGEEITDSSSSSVGLAVKQYCNKQVQLQTVVQQTMSDVSRIIDMAMIGKEFLFSIGKEFVLGGHPNFLK